MYDFPAGIDIDISFSRGQFRLGVNSLVVSCVAEDNRTHGTVYLELCLSSFQLNASMVVEVDIAVN